MDTNVLLLLLAGLLMLVVGLQVMLLLKRPHSAPGWEAERDRLCAEIEREREAARAQIAEAGRLNGRLGALESELANRCADSARLEQLVAEHQRRAEDCSIASQRAGAALLQREATLTEVHKRKDHLEAEVAALNEKLSALGKEHADAMAHLRHAGDANAEMRQFLEQAQEKLKGAFAELAGRVFDERGQLFEKNVKLATSQGKTDLETLLKPFAEKLGEFRSRVDTLYGEEAKERSALLGAVTELKSLNQNMAESADSLTRALKGSSKVRGDWGELMLESVLRGSGLEEGQHYDKQASTRDEEGRALRPDVIVRLPDNRMVVVDSKVNLIAWQDAMNNVDNAELHSVALRRHCDGLRQHVKDLGARDYPRALGEKALDVTIAFVPIEGALSAALGADAGLQTFAFERKVVFASPNTLMALLRVVDRLWSRDKSQRLATDIADAGGKLLDALNAFLGEFKVVGRKMTESRDAYDKALKHLDSPRGMLPRGRRLVELGVRGKKPLLDELKEEVPELLELPLEDVEPDGREN
jgi:DNA recombination protein RmuC